MTFTRIGNENEARIYLNDCFMLRDQALLNNKSVGIEQNPFVSKLFIDDNVKTIEIMNWNGDYIKVEASSLFDILLSIGKEVKQTKQMKIIIQRLKKIIHDEYY